MENKLLILLKNLKIESQANILKEGKISKVVVARDNSYTFHLVFNQILPFEEYQLVMKLNFLIKMNYYYIPDTF